MMNLEGCVVVMSTLRNGLEMDSRSEVYLYYLTPFKALSETQHGAMPVVSLNLCACKVLSAIMVESKGQRCTPHPSPAMC
jgi:hypothetical protein